MQLNIQDLHLTERTKFIEGTDRSWCTLFCSSDFILVELSMPRFWPENGCNTEQERDNSENEWL